MFWKFSKRFLMVAPVFFSSGVALAASVTPDQSNKTRLAERYRGLPLSFEANRGQSASQARFLARGSGYALLLAPSKIMLLMNQSRQADPADPTVASKPLQPYGIGVAAGGGQSGDATAGPGATPWQEPLPYRESI